MDNKANLAERETRYRRIREAMAREGLDALILGGNGSHFHRGYLRYFADTHMWAGDALLLIPLVDEPTLCWVTYAGPGQPGEGWVSDLRRGIYPEKRKGFPPSVASNSLPGGTVIPSLPSSPQKVRPTPYARRCRDT